MTSPYGPCLTGVGFLEGGKLTKAARTKYVQEVTALLATGNADGKGGSPSTKIFNSLFPLPPIGGPLFPNPTTLSMEPLFWFGPDPLAAIMVDTMADPMKTPVWNAIFPDLLLAGVAKALDAPGSTPLFPLFDVTVAFPNIKGFPIALPDLAIEANILPPPKLLIKLADLGIKLSLPLPPLPPIPPALPSFLPPALPGISLPPLKIDLPDLLLSLLKLPFDLLVSLVLPPKLDLVLDLPGLPKVVLKLALDLLINILAPFLQILPKVMIASLIIWLKDIVSMVCVDIVGMLVGAGGAMTKTIATLTGLI